jgi:hypothetical protein
MPAKKLVIKNKNVNKNNIKITINPKKAKKARNSAPRKKKDSPNHNIINVTVPQFPQYNNPSNYIYPIPDRTPVKVEVERSFTDANKLNEVGTLIKKPVGNIPVETQTDLTSGPFMRSDKGPVMIKRKKPIVAYPVNEDQTSLNVIL